MSLFSAKKQRQFTHITRDTRCSRNHRSVNDRAIFRTPAICVEYLLSREVLPINMPSSKGKPTDPKLREKVKEQVKNETNKDGGGKGQWSAWKVSYVLFGTARLPVWVCFVNC